MTDITEFQKTAMDYKRRISGSFMLVEPAKIKTKVFGDDYCVTRKIDGIMQCLFWRNGEAVSVGSGGAVLNDLPCLNEFAEAMKQAGFQSAAIVAELYVPVRVGRPRCHDVSTALSSPEGRSTMRYAPFDILELNGKAFQADHYKETHAELCRIFKGTGLVPVEMRYAGNKDEIEEIFEEWVTAEGAEGLVVHSDSPVVWKIKPRHTIDAAVVGYSMDERGVNDLLFAVRRKDGKFQVFVPATNGLTDEQRQSLLVELEADKVESDYIRLDCHNVAYQMVKPRLVFELSVHELISESNAGKVRQNALIEFDETTGWHAKGMTPGVAALSPAIVRLRDDKSVDYEMIRVEQLSEITPFAEAKNTLENLPESTLLARKVFQKTSGEKVMLQKFVVWKTNKEQSGRYPAYVFFYTDYSSGRKDFLKRDLRVSNSEQQIRSIMDEFITANVKKGWQEVG